jgi:hypothetical protein
MPVIGVLGAVSPEFRPVQLNLAGFREGLGELGFVEGQTGLRPPTLCPAGTASGLWDGRRDHVHCFELRLAETPKLQLDNREIIAARLTSPGELPRMGLTGPTAAYLGICCPSGVPGGAGRLGFG